MAADISQEVDQLLKERDKYEAWLARLESEKGQANERAYDRVRADYKKRLDDVVGKLKAYSANLQGKLQEVEQGVADLESQRREAREQLEEARLRRSVGEYQDDSEWQALEGRLLESVKQTDSRLEGARAEIVRLKEIVGSVQGARPTAPPKPAPPPERPAPSAEAQEPAPPPEPSPGEGGAPEEEEGYLSLEELVLEDRDPAELGLEPENTGRAESGRRAGGPAEAEGAEAESADDDADVGDELAFLESLSLSEGEEGESFSFLENQGSGTPQTIICPHCSAANDPAEWYCTECGEELPAE